MNSLKPMIETAANKLGITPAEYIHSAVLAALEKDGLLPAGKNIAQSANLDAWAKEYQQQTGEEISFFCAFSPALALKAERYNKRTMYINNKSASVIWKVVFLLLVTWALLDGSGILAGHYTSNFPHMFTNVSNIAGWLYFLCAVIWLIPRDTGKPFAPVFKYTVTISLLVTMIIAHFMVFDAMFRDGRLVWHQVVMHYVAPCMALLDWLLFDEKGRMHTWGPFAWVSLAVAYLAFTMIAVGVFGVYMGGGTTADITSYPYDFLDPAIAGNGGVIGFCGGMIVAFVILGYVLLGVDRLMGRGK